MQQVLFTLPLPFFKSSFPDGIPMYGFGAMLFVCFVAVTLWGSQRGKKMAHMPPERYQDMVIWIFVFGIIGARVLYMIQYSHHFPDQSIAGLAGAFFKIWEGGIIFYGSALGGVIGYGLFYQFILRRLDVSTWRLADAVAPLLALGLAIGRIGCYLNGCCWGQVACEECRTVPLGAAEFPLLPAHARQQLVSEQHLQTTTGFVTETRDHSRTGDPRAKVKAVEPGSTAVGKVEVGDRIVAVNGLPNYVIVDLVGSEASVNEAADLLAERGGTKTTGRTGKPRVLFVDYEKYLLALASLPLSSNVAPVTTDHLEEKTSNWPRGQSQLKLTVERNGERKELPAFSPKTVGLYPTQVYETVSMGLLILLLIAYYPFRRHDGQVMVLLMVGYAVHRFINESLRIEPTVGGGLTLSQWGSVVIFVAAVGIEIYLRRTMPTPPEPLPPPKEPAAPAASTLPPAPATATVPPPPALGA